MYRQTKHNNLIDFLEYFESLVHNNTNLIISGDVNINILNNTSDDSNYKQILSTHSYRIDHIISDISKTDHNILYVKRNCVSTKTLIFLRLNFEKLENISKIQEINKLIKFFTNSKKKFTNISLKMLEKIHTTYILYI